MRAIPAALALACLSFLAAATSACLPSDDDALFTTGTTGTTGADGASEHSSSLATTTDRWDVNVTMCNVGGVWLHCCNTDEVMVGLHVGDDAFTCRKLTHGFSGARFLDAGTQRNGMHSCPFGTVMIGFHASRNLLACQRPTQAPTFEFIDGYPPTQNSYPMHVCNGSHVMAGVHVGKNLLLCDV